MTELVYSAHPAKDFFDKAQKSMHRHLVPLDAAQSGDLVGVLFFTAATKLGLDTWTARDFLVLEGDGRICGTAFNDLPETLQSDAAQMAMRLLYDHPEEQSCFGDVAREMRDLCPEWERKMNGDLIYGIALVHGAALIFNNEGGPNHISTASDTQNMLNRYARVLHPVPVSAHETIELASQYTPIALSRMADAFGAAGRGRLFPTGLPQPRLPILSQAVTSEMTKT